MEPAAIAAFEAQGRSAIKTWVWHDTIRCAIYWGYSGFNGYVQLPEHSVDRVIAEATDAVQQDIGLEAPSGYDILEGIDAPGGLTFGPVEGWVGFDTGHAGDNWTDEEIEKYLAEGDPLMWQELMLRKRRMEEAGLGDMWMPGRIGREYGHIPGFDHNWTMEELVEETDHVAAQIYERLRGAEARNGS